MRELVLMRFVYCLNRALVATHHILNRRAARKLSFSPHYHLITTSLPSRPQQACCALSNLATGNNNCCQSIVSARGVEQLMHVMQVSVSKVCRAGQCV